MDPRGGLAGDGVFRRGAVGAQSPSNIPSLVSLAKDSGKPGFFTVLS